MAELRRGSASPAVRRGLRLLAGGALGGGLAWAGAMATFAVLNPSVGLRSAGLGGLVAWGFLALGQLIQSLVADLPGGAVMAVALLSYGLRVTGMGLLGWAAMTGALGDLDSRAVVWTVIVVVLGWLVAGVWTFTRLRIPVFDDPSQSVDKPARGG